MTPVAPTPKGLADMEAVIAQQRAKMGREATPTELARWARTFEAIAVAFRARAHDLQVAAQRPATPWGDRPSAAPVSPAPPPLAEEGPVPRKARKATAPRPTRTPAADPLLPVRRPNFVMTPGLVSSPEKVLAHLPKKPPGHGKGSTP